MKGNKQYELIYEPVIEEAYSTIIITGNGFDLQCKLNSKYIDFFNWCVENNEAFKELLILVDDKNANFPKILKLYDDNHDITIWDFYFLNRKKSEYKYWYEVEKEINNTFQSQIWDGIVSNNNYPYKENYGNFQISQLYYSDIIA